MAHEGKSATCCRRATAEELETDAEAFDCETCEVRVIQDSLDEHDRIALRTYDLLQTSAVRDLQLTPLVFDALALKFTQTEALLLIEKLDVIHRSRQPGEDVDLPGNAQGG